MDYYILKSLTLKARSYIILYMPNTKTAKKALRQNIRRRQKNSKDKKELKETIKKFKKMVTAGEKDKAKEQLPTVYKKLDKSAKIKLIKKNKASRLKARLTKSLEQKTA